MSGRLSLALEKGIVALPEGQTLVVDATTETDLSAFDRDRTTLYTRSATAEALFRSQGWQSDPQPDNWTSAILVLPRARDAQRAAMRWARHLTSGPIIVDGDKTSGVDAFYRELRERAEVTDAWSKAHGKVFTVKGGDFSDWPAYEPTLSSDGWWRAPGVFSADGIDKASALLAEALPRELKGSVVDLGAGWGYLSRAILEREGVTSLDLVEDDHLALRAAAKNIDDPRARFHAADARTWRPDAPVDHVVTNPPFHTGRAADPELGRAFIRSAAAMLKPKGSLWLVANRQLPYESTLEDSFRNVQTLTPNPSFKLFHATSPRRAPKG